MTQSLSSSPGPNPASTAAAPASRDGNGVPQSADTSIGQYLIDRLHALGLRHVFGIPGDYVLGLYKMLDSSPTPAMFAPLGQPARTMSMRGSDLRPTSERLARGSRSMMLN